MDSHWIELVEAPDLEVLASLAEPWWIWSVPEGAVGWANPAAVALWGVASLERLQALRFDRAMPAMGRLERLARAGRPAGVSTETLVFWTPKGSLRLTCQCRAISMLELPGLVLVRPLPAGEDEAGATGRRQALPSRVNGPGAAVPAARAVVPPAPPQPSISAEDSGTLAEIARLIRARGAASDTPPSPASAPPAMASIKPPAATADDDPDPPPASVRTLKDVEFIAKIGHEVRTPLSSIIGFSEIMQDEQLGPMGNAKYKEYVADILDSARHALSLINDLLDLSKVESGALPLDPVAIEIGEIAKRALGAMVPQAEAAGVTLLAAIDPELPKVIADRRSLKQILLNLIANAIRFTDRGGRVTVAAQRSAGGSLTLSIIDTGIGMAAAELKRALEPFGQTGSGRGQGTGLGLPLTRSLALANGAEFHIESATGAGTRIDVVFPPNRLAAAT